MLALNFRKTLSELLAKEDVVCCESKLRTTNKNNKYGFLLVPLKS